ncbi:MAG: hypothetical protein SPI25_02730 [Dialister sp.]|nr:hypothetical protein [Dialister sp.]
METRTKQEYEHERQPTKGRIGLPGTGMKGCKVFIKVCDAPFRTDINQAIASCIRAKYLKL